MGEGGAPPYRKPALPAMPEAESGVTHPLRCLELSTAGIDNPALLKEFALVIMHSAVREEWVVLKISFGCLLIPLSQTESSRRRTLVIDVCQRPLLT